jgi:hypothetical protein
MLSFEKTGSILERYNLSHLIISGTTCSKSSFPVALGKQIYPYLAHSHGTFAMHLVETLALDINLNLPDVQDKISSLVKDCQENQVQLIQDLSDIVGSVFNILSNSNSITMIPVFPKERFPHSQIIHFHYAGVGLFYPLSWTGKSVIVVHEVDSEEECNTATSCHCGRSRKSDTPKCVTRPGQKYPSRCSCLAKGISCTSECECQGCENPVGRKPSQMGKRNVKRHRIHHHAQNVLETAKRGIAFMLESKEIPTLGCWTRMEHYIFEALLAEIENKNTPDIDNEAIKEKFNAACHVLLSKVSCQLSIGSKSLKQVQAKIRVHERSISTFTELFKLEISQLFSKIP